MSADATGSAVRFMTALRSASTAWPDELWAGSVAWADGILRSYYGIYEFTDDPDCVLRVGLGQARAPVSLSDGTDVQFGELVGTLHFWNEHLPRYSARGPDLGWACAVRDRVRHSLRAFSEYVEGEPAWQDVRRDSYRDRFAGTSRQHPRSSAFFSAMGLNGFPLIPRFWRGCIASASALCCGV